MQDFVTGADRRTGHYEHYGVPTFFKNGFARLPPGRSSPKPAAHIYVHKPQVFQCVNVALKYFCVQKT